MGDDLTQLVNHTSNLELNHKPPHLNNPRKSSISPNLPKFYLDVNGRLQQNSPRRPHSIAVAPSFNLYQAPKAPSARPLSTHGFIGNGYIQQPIPRRPEVIKSSHIGVPKSTSDNSLAANPFNWPHPLGCVGATNPFMPTSQSSPIITGPNLACPNYVPKMGAADYQLPKTPSLANSVMNMINESVYNEQQQMSLKSNKYDYPLSKSPSYVQNEQFPKSNSFNQITKEQKNNRRLSLPVPNQNFAASPKPSPTFHGLPMTRTSVGYDSRQDSGLFLGVSPSSTMSSTPNSVREALQHLLAQPRSGVDVLDGRMALFIDILDAQERFSQVSTFLAHCYLRYYNVCIFARFISYIANYPFELNTILSKH